MERIVNTSGINLNANYEGNLTDDILIIFKFVFQFELNFLNFFLCLNTVILVTAFNILDYYAYLIAAIGFRILFINLKNN